MHSRDIILNLFIYFCNMSIVKAKKNLGQHFLKDQNIARKITDSRDQNWNDLRRALEEEVNYSWVAVVCVVGILSHVVRALRWQLLKTPKRCCSFVPRHNLHIPYTARGTTTITIQIFQECASDTNRSSTFGMVAPVQGGIGAWHFMVISALMLYLPHTPEMESMTLILSFHFRYNCPNSVKRSCCKDVS